MSSWACQAGQQEIMQVFKRRVSNVSLSNGTARVRPLRLNLSIAVGSALNQNPGFSSMCEMQACPVGTAHSSKVPLLQTYTYKPKITLAKDETAAQGDGCSIASFNQQSTDMHASLRRAHTTQHTNWTRPCEAPLAT